MVGKEPAGAGSGSRPSAFLPGRAVPQAPGGSTVLTDLSSDTQPTHPPLWTRGCLTPTLILTLAWPSPAQLFLTSDQGRGHRLQHHLPSAGTPPSFGGRSPSQGRRLPSALRWLRDLGRQAVPSAALRLDTPCSLPRWLLCLGTQVQLRGSKRGQFMALPVWDSGLDLRPSRPKK